MARSDLTSRSAKPRTATNRSLRRVALISDPKTQPPAINPNARSDPSSGVPYRPIWLVSLMTCACRVIRCLHPVSSSDARYVNQVVRRVNRLGTRLPAVDRQNFGQSSRTSSQPLREPLRTNGVVGSFPRASGCPKPRKLGPAFGLRRNRRQRLLPFPVNELHVRGNALGLPIVRMLRMQLLGQQFPRFVRGFPRALEFERTPLKLRQHRAFLCDQRTIS